MLVVLVLLFVGLVEGQPTASDSCLVWNNNDSVCEQCLEGFYLEYYFCAPCSPLCSCRNTQNFCEACRQFTIDSQLQIKLSSYRDRDRCRFCNTSISYCLTCQQSNICTACFNGFYPTLQGICSNQTCVPDCEVCADNATCKICSLGYALGVGGQCFLQDCTSNCTLCASQTQCKNCIDSYYQQDGDCLPCMEQCLKCTNQSDCELCAPGFYYLNNTCFNTTMSNCVLYNGTFDSPLCLACQPGFYISGGSCNQCQGCLLCTQSFICLSQCSSGNVSFNYACISHQGLFYRYIWHFLLLGLTLLYFLA